MTILTAEEKLEVLQLIEEKVKAIQVTREDFSELKGVIAELVQAQARTEQRITELSQAQERTEQRMGELERSMAELAQAQARTEKEVARLARDMGNVQKELGGLSHTVGYNLEDRAYKALPMLIKKDTGVVLRERPIRRFIELPDGVLREINIYGEGKKNGKGLFIIGEAKAQMSKKDIDGLLKLVDKLSPFLKKEILPVGVTYSALPDVERYAMDKGVRLYYSYEF
jgi:uncharacterized FlaG/YvyC family protein